MSESKALLHLDDGSFDEHVLKSDVPVLVDFWAEWCGPCRMLGPIVEKLADKFDGRAKVTKVDVDSAAEVARRYGIRSIPSVLLFVNGEVQDTMIGVRPEQEYQDKLEALIS